MKLKIISVLKFVERIKERERVASFLGREESETDQFIIQRSFRKIMKNLELNILLDPNAAGTKFPNSVVVSKLKTSDCRRIRTCRWTRIVLT